MSMANKKLRGAIIGYGYIASKGHLPAYTERSRITGDVEIVAIADICPERRDIVLQAHPEIRLYPTAEILIEQEAEEIDFIDICTPPAFHAAIADMALKHGLHVLCEKPLTTTLEEAKGIISTARSAKRVLYPCHNYRHAPVIKAIREILDTNQIGHVRSVTLSTFRNTHAKGVTEWHSHWRREHKYSGGGIAMDHGSHTFYLAFDWLGSYPTHITAKMHNLDIEHYDTEDNFAAVLTFPRGVAHVSLSWTAGVRKVIYTIQGDKGAITVDDDNIEIATQIKTQGPDVAQGAIEWAVSRRSIASDWMDASHVQWFKSLFNEFFDAIREDNFVSEQTISSFRCIELIQQAYASSQQNSVELKLGTPVPT